MLLCNRASGLSDYSTSVFVNKLSALCAVGNVGARKKNSQSKNDDISDFVAHIKIINIQVLLMTVLIKNEILIFC